MRNKEVKVNKVYINEKSEQLTIFSYYWGNNGWYIVCVSSSKVFADSAIEDDTNEDVTAFHIHELAFEEIASHAGFTGFLKHLPFYSKGGDSSVDRRDLMQERLSEFINAGWELSDVWEEDAVQAYPEFLPSFDEFLNEFSSMLEEPFLTPLPLPPISEHTRRLAWQYNSGQVYSGDTVVARAERDANLARDIPPTQRDANMRLVARAPRMYEILRQIIIDFERDGKVEQVRIDQAKIAIDTRTVSEIEESKLGKR